MTAGHSPVFESFDPQIAIFWEGMHKCRWREPMRLIYDTLLVFVSHGRCDLEIGKQIHKLRPGSLALIPPQVWHQTIATSPGGTKRHCIHFRWNRQTAPVAYPLQAMEKEHFHADCVQPVPLEIGLLLPIVVHTQVTSPIEDFVHLLLRKLRAREETSDLMLWPVLQHVLQSVSPQDDHGIQDVSGKGKRAICAVKAFIDAEYARPIGYEDYCEITKFSKSHLCKIFHEVIGTSPNNYLNSVRIFHARHLLVNSSGNISEVARSVGIQDINYFSRLFKKKAGISPSEYLKQH